MYQCCVAGFEWDGKPVGKETKIGKNDVYITGTNKDVAILISKSGVQSIAISEVEHDTSS